MPRLQAFQHFHQLRDLTRLTDLRKRHHEIVRQLADLGEESLEKQIQRPVRTRPQRFGKRLDSDSDERRKARLCPRLRQGLRRGLRMSVFLGIGTIPVAIFKIDPKILYRLSLEFCYGAVEHRTCERAARDSEALGERSRIWGVVANQFQRIRAQPRRSLSLE